jgi:hypothetical protein
MSRSAQGVALVLVLMVTAVLAITVLGMSLGAKDRVRQSADLLTRTEALLISHSHETAIAYSLMTEPWVVSDSQGLLVRADGPYGEKWNFRGAPFTVQDVTIRIQDESGLFAFPRPGQSVDEFRSLLAVLGYSEPQVRSMLNQLLEQIQSSSSEGRDVIPVQDVSELFDWQPIDQRQIEQLAALTTLAPVKSFNPATAPKEVLMVRYGGAVGSALYDLARQGQLDNASFLATVGEPPEDGTMMYPGPAFRVWVGVGRQGTIAGREMAWLLQPYDNEPFREWSSRRLMTAAAEGPD